MNRLNKKNNFKLVTIIYLITLIACVKCQQGGFSDQIYSTKINNNNNYQPHRSNINNNNNNSPQVTTAGSLQYSIDELDNKFVIDVKRNKDGKLEPLVRKTQQSSGPSSYTSSAVSSGANQPDVNSRLEKPVTSSGIIHFPTDYPSKIDYSGNTVLTPKYPAPQKKPQLIPKCNRNGIGNSFCTQVDNYPVEAVIKAIQQDSNKFDAVFGEDLLPEPPTEISQRIDPDFDEESLCDSRERLIFPQAGMTIDNSWSFIINHENYTQGIRVEECSKPGRPCMMSENFPIGYRTECKQKFIYRQLLSMNEHGIVKKDLFQLPSCCKCYIKSSY